MLRLFLERPKRLISRQAMQEALGGAAGDSFDRAMDVRISRLRTKLREDPKNPRLIKTIYGAGYIFLGTVGAPARRSACATALIGAAVRLRRRQQRTSTSHIAQPDAPRATSAIRHHARCPAARPRSLVARRRSSARYCA